jgi:AcrR family transcriptional regulator
MALVDERGTDSLSLAAVAERAGVAAPSLYKHVGGLADLRELMVLRVIRELTARSAGVVMGRSGDEAVAALMRAYRDYVVTHPGRYALMPLNVLQVPALTAAGRELLAVFVAVMRGYGLDGAAATHAIRRLRAAVHGFATLEAGGGFGMPEDVDVSFEHLVTMMVRSLQ